MQKQTSIVENFILTENYFNTFLESNEDLYSIDEASIIDGIISKFKSIPKTAKIEIRKRTPEEQKKFKESKQYKNLKAKLERKATKVIKTEMKEKGDKGFTMNNPDVIKKHKLYMLVSGFLELITGAIIFIEVPGIPGFLGLLGVIAYQALRSTETFSDFLDLCNSLIKSKTPSLWNWLNKVEARICANTDENKISGKDESYVFTLDC